MSANIKKSAQYQLVDNRRALIVYYLVVIALHLLFIISMNPMVINISRANYSASSNGVDMISALFLFVVGLSAFKGNFGMLIQNGFSRRSVFLGRLLSFGLMALLMTVIDQLLAFVLQALGNLLVPGSITVSTIFSMMYTGGGLPASIFFDLTLYSAALMCGYVLTILFYRLGKLGKVLVGAGVPSFLLIFWPMIDYRLFEGRVTYNVANFFVHAFGIEQNQPWLAVLSFTVLAALAGLFSWLMMRRATVRR